MFVLATAGHVDHGKSTLVRVLTQMNPDRLREEQQRGMTLDLGFAWMTLPSPTDSISLGIIDVPGHIDFIDNMLAGVGGIDAAMLVIAADEGPMPQTREHLNILQLLRVPRAVVALTKADLVDEDWLDIVRSEVQGLLASTELTGAPIVPVSAKSGAGLPALVQALAEVLRDAPPRADLGKPRLSVDRVFSMQGFGTVVTGTLIDGSFAVGDEVVVLTQKGETLSARVRGLQTHKQKLERAQPGSRVAMNLVGVEVSQLARGSVVARPHVLRPTTLLDVRIEMLPGSADRHVGAVLHHNAEVKIFNGAAQSMAQVWLLEGSELAAGQSSWAQLLLTSHLAPANGDRFIVRLPSPSITLGGGVVVDAHPAMRYRRRGGTVQASVLARLDALSKGTPAERVINALNTQPFATQAELGVLAQLSEPDMNAAMAELIENGTVLIAQDIIGLASMWRTVSATVAEALASFHTAQPLLEGMPRDTLRSRLKLDARAFNALLSLGPHMAVPFQDKGETVRLMTHAVQLSPAQQQASDALLAQCRANPWATPSVKDCKLAVGERVYDVLVRQRRLVQCGAEVVLLPDTYDAAVARIRDLIAREGQITAAQVRDAFGTSRKYALGVLEHLDEMGVTKRVGDARVLKR